MNPVRETLYQGLVVGAISALVLASCTTATPFSTALPVTNPSPYPAVATASATPLTLPDPEVSPTAGPASPTAEPSPVFKPIVHDQTGPLYDTVLSIPVGEEGIRYRGAGMPEIETTGPNGLAVLPDGSFVIGDTFDNRLLRYDARGNRLADIDLTSLGILNVSDIVAAQDELYLLEISFQVTPERYRVNRLSLDGRLIGQLDIPKGFHFEDGLIGLAAGEGQILLELGGGMVRYYQMAGPSAEFSGEFYGLPAYGRLYQTHYESPCGGNPFITVGNMKFETGKTLGGGLGMLAANPDGSFYAWRTDVVDDLPVMISDQTVHYFDASGEQLGVARYPLADWYFHLLEYLAVGPDGNVYALITREKSVDVLRLNFYRQLEPIQPGAAQPLVTSSAFPPFPEARCDCSQVQHLLPDSPEAQRIAQEFLTNYQQDWPTEYMALDPLWGIDRLGEYAIIQGAITEESRGLIAVHREPRGFVMVADYIVSAPSLRNSIIPDYFRAKLPEAPAELFYCTDLSRFVGEYK